MPLPELESSNWIKDLVNSNKMLSLELPNWKQRFKPKKSFNQIVLLLVLLVVFLVPSLSLVLGIKSLNDSKIGVTRVVEFQSSYL